MPHHPRCCGCLKRTYSLVKSGTSSWGWWWCVLADVLVMCLGWILSRIWQKCPIKRLTQAPRYAFIGSFSRQQLFLAIEGVWRWIFNNTLCWCLAAWCFLQCKVWLRFSFRCFANTKSLYLKWRNPEPYLRLYLGVFPYRSLTYCLYSTPWKIKMVHLQIIHLERKIIWTKLPGNYVLC